MSSKFIGNFITKCAKSQYFLNNWLKLGVVVANFLLLNSGKLIPGKISAQDSNPAAINLLFIYHSKLNFPKLYVSLW